MSKSTLRHSLIGPLFWLAGAMAQAANPSPHPVIPTPQTTRPMPVVPVHGKFEASFTLPHASGNPFDPTQNDVQVVFHRSEGTATDVLAFWDGDRWKVRFAPARPGRYTLTVRRNGQPTHPAALTTAVFRCVASADPGFIRRDRDDVQHFVFDSRQGYYPVGINQAWTERGSPDYPGTFALMRRNHLNWARIWMAFWDEKALDWASNEAQNPPPGRLLLSAARRWDMILDDAARDGVYVQMCLQHHGQYTNGPDANWKQNPANIANGGFLKNPDDFFTDPTARRLTKAKYRYIVARWGYSTHLMAFELFNEVQNIGEARRHFGDVVSWHREMAAYIRSIDVNHHLLTTSLSDPGSPLSKIGLDYDQTHAYVHDGLAYFAGRDVTGLTTPVFVGEWGPDGNDYGYGGLTTPFVHDGLWASLMTPDAGDGMMWYWETLSKRDWWPLFGAAGAFVQGAEVAGQTHLSPIDLPVTGPSSDLPMTLPKGWDTTTRFDITVTRDGRAPGLGDVSSFIQGRNHRDMMTRPVTFHLQGPVRFLIQIGTAAKAGADPEIRLDGHIAQTAHYDPAGQDRVVGQPLTVSVPTGDHTVSLFNAGPDWYTVAGLTLSDYAPAVAVLAKANAHAVFFWAYNRDRRDAAPIKGTIKIHSLEDGTYALRFWNTQHEASPPPSRTVRSTQGRLTLSLPSAAGDIAGSLVQLH